MNCGFICAATEAVPEVKEADTITGLDEPQAKTDDDSDIEDVSPAVDLPPPPPPPAAQVDEQPGFADFGDAAPAPPKAPSPVPPPRPPQPDLSGQQQVQTAAAQTAAVAQEEPKAASTTLEAAPANIAIPRPTSPRAPSPGIVLPPPAAPKETPESQPTAPSPTPPTTDDTATQPQPQQQNWEGGFDNNFSDLGLSSEVQSGGTDVDAAFAAPPLAQASARAPSPSPEPERAKSPSLVAARRAVFITLSMCFLADFFLCCTVTLWLPFVKM